MSSRKLALRPLAPFAHGASEAPAEEAAEAAGVAEAGLAADGFDAVAGLPEQPLDLPNAGSMFKRPVGGYAGTLIAEAGLKGTSVGGAQVSTKHAGFIVNTGNATAKDVYDLTELVIQRVYENSGHKFKLEREVVMLGKIAP